MLTALDTCSSSERTASMVEPSGLVMLAGRGYVAGSKRRFESDGCRSTRPAGFKLEPLRERAGRNVERCCRCARVTEDVVAVVAAVGGRGAFVFGTSRGSRRFSVPADEGRRVVELISCTCSAALGRPGTCSAVLTGSESEVASRAAGPPID